jgi:osmotically-inducible protein OsmY
VPSTPAVDKAGSPSDEESVREIRQLLAADQSLSATARRVTIVAREGRVWLRGQVNTAEERATIERAARQAIGVVDVRNELVVLE